MKNTLIILLFFLSFSSFAGNNKADKTNEAKAREWIKNQPLEFVENKGQFMRTDGKAADEVLFKTSFGGCDIYITDKGLSYVFVKFEEAGSPKSEDGREEREDPKLKFRERKEGENKKVSYYRLDLNLEGASISKNNIIKENESKQGHSNYFYAHCPEGIYDVKAYSKITIKNIYKGIDWVIYTNSDSKEHPLKYDFVVHPGADYKDIKIKFLNAQSTSLSDNDTKLKIQTIAGNIEEGNLYSYQSNSNNEINSKYLIDKDSTISFEIANYDTTKTLVIDPLVWATYYGGNRYDRFTSASVDSFDNIYIAGSTSSSDFPVQQLSGAFWQSNNYGSQYTDDIILLKFSCQGVREWATYYGGSDDDYASSICVDSQNNIYLAGTTQSTNCPTQQFASAYWQMPGADFYDVIILKFNSQGIRQWATLYGAEEPDVANSICVDKQDNLYVIGITYSKFFPTQQFASAYWQSNNAGYSNAFVLKFDSQGNRLWATYYGGENWDSALNAITDNNDNLYVVGGTTSPSFPVLQFNSSYLQYSNSFDFGIADAFILKFNNQGVRQWATCYGGTNGDVAQSICIDSQNNTYITGNSGSPDFPTQQMQGAYWQSNLSNNSLEDAFILKFNENGIRLWATYYGGSVHDYGKSIKTDKQDNIYIIGTSTSNDFPTQQLAGEYWQLANSSVNTNGSIGTVYMLKLNNLGVRQWATFYGNISINTSNYASDIVIDHSENVYFIGNLGGSGTYTLNPENGAYYDSIWKGNSDGFIFKMSNYNNFNKPTILQANKNNICISDNGDITLTASGNGGNLLKWYSDGCGLNYFGQNSPLTIPAPKQTTTYYARWEGDCSLSECDSITIFVKDCDLPFYFPNSFTPSGDGLNEVFKIETLAEFINFKLLIFNRWGEQIFESNDKNKGWDGNFNGKKAPFGVYVYKFSGTIVGSNEQLNKTGRVTLIR